MEGATLIPKDVVIVIDKSGSMDWSSYGGHTLMEIAKEAAKTIVDMLNPRDRVRPLKRQLEHPCINKFVLMTDLLTC